MTQYPVHGCHPGIKDHRDYKYGDLRPKSLHLLRSIVRPSRSYLRLDLLPPVFDQGPLGACVGHGVSEVCDYVEAKEGHPLILSRLAAYYWARGGVPEDCGATIRDGIKAVIEHGLPLESLWPYDITKWRQPPSAEAVAEAAHRAIDLEYYRLDDIDQMKDCLVSGFPVVFGTALFKSFQDVGADGFVPMPVKDEAPDGGHCMIMVGYSDKLRIIERRGGFFIRNSWGHRWAQLGCCWIPYDYIEQNAWDFWTVRRMAA